MIVIEDIVTEEHIFGWRVNELIVIEDIITEEPITLLLKRTLFICYCVFYLPCLQAACSLVNLLLKRTLFICYYVFRLFCLQATRVHLLLCLHNYPVYSQLASCLNKGIYIYIIRRQKSVKFNYFSNLPICRRYANNLNQRKLLICRTTSQSIDLYMITKAQNPAI